MYQEFPSEDPAAFVNNSQIHFHSLEDTSSDIVQPVSTKGDSPDVDNTDRVALRTHRCQLKMSTDPSSSSSPSTRFDRILKQEIGASLHSGQDAGFDRRLAATRRQQLAIYESSYQKIQEQVKQTQEDLVHFLELVNGLETSSKDMHSLDATIKQLQAFAQLHTSLSVTERDHLRRQ